MTLPIKPQQHLINILKSTSNPNFTLFLGAGASVTSGVSPARKLISQWRSVYSGMYGEDMLKEQSWYDSPREYSELFETLYDQPSQRREFIETCIKDATPSWGYIYLANLLNKNIFNTVFTTNFDDLVNEACYSFTTDLKPIVSAHDSSIKSVRLTSPRPKIIKLHGDFLFDNIKNTVRELESLEDNMRSKFRQYASEFGMIVIGYAGNDRSIMDTLNTLLHSEANFPHGIYWCVRKNTDLKQISRELENLRRFPRFHLVEIDGFDELFAEIHHELNLTLQDEVANPYTSLAKKLDNFVSRNDADDGDDVQNEYIQKDIAHLSNHVQKIYSATSLIEKFEAAFKNINIDEDSEALKGALEQLVKEAEIIKSKFSDDVHIISTPNVLLADVALRDEDYDEAIRLAQLALDNRVTTEAISILIKAMAANQNLDGYQLVIDKLKCIKSLSSKAAHRLNSAAVDLISGQFYEQSLELLAKVKNYNLPIRTVAFINLNIALATKLQDKCLDDEMLSDLECDFDQAVEREDYWLAFGLGILLDKEEFVVSAFSFLDQSQQSVVLLKEQPIMTLMSDALYEKLKEIALEHDSSIHDLPSFSDEDVSDARELTANEDVIDIGSYNSDNQKEG